MNIAVVGTGYVGLVTGNGLAHFGHQITCVDIDQEKVNQLKNAILPIYEPNLEELLKNNINSGRITFTTDLSLAVNKCEVLFLALPTPPGKDGAADLSFVLEVAKDIAGMITKHTILVNKSTVPVGTADQVTELMRTITDIPFDVVSNPEFLREGYAVNDFLKPSRVVIGSKSEKAIETMKKIYHPLTLSGTPIMVMDEKSSELTKYAANSFLATKITFMNEVANFCEIVGANVDDVRLGMGSDERIGNRFLFPGIGYGGSCFPKDVKALINSGKSKNYPFKILEAVESVNKKQKTILFDSVEAYFNSDLKGKTIAMWGLSFKPNTDDIREASALDMIDILLKKDCKVQAFDPAAMEKVKPLYPEVSYFDNMYACLEGADVLIIATEWPEFQNPDFKRISELLKHSAIFDGRNLFDTTELNKLGFYYKSIGRITVG